MQKSAIVFGATGLIGEHLLQCLLESAAYDSVIAVVRRRLGTQHPKLRELIADYRSLETIKDQLVGDDVFCCLGTTRKKTPDLGAYYEIDHDYPVLAAKLTKNNGANTFLLVSAVGANPKSANFYLRMKGETERDVKAVGMKSTHIFRPSLLTGKRQEKRLAERISESIFTVANPLLIGGLKRFRSIPAMAVANAMHNAAQTDVMGNHIYYWGDIKRLV